MSLTSEMSVREKVQSKGLVVVRSGGVHCISLSSEVQRTVQPLTKDCGFVSSASSSKTCEPVVSRFFLTFLGSSASVSGMSGFLQFAADVGPTKTALQESLCALLLSAEVDKNIVTGCRLQGNTACAFFRPTGQTQKLTSAKQQVISLASTRHRADYREQSWWVSERNNGANRR